MRRLRRLLADKLTIHHHTQHTAAASGGSTELGVANITSNPSETSVNTTATTTAVVGPAGEGRSSFGAVTLAKLNARHWLHPTASATTTATSASMHSNATSPSVTPPAASTPSASTPVMATTASSKDGVASTAAASTTTAAAAGSSTILSSATLLQQQQQQLLSSEELRRSTFYRTVCASFQSAILLLDMATGEISDYDNERSAPSMYLSSACVYVCVFLSKQKYVWRVFVRLWIDYKILKRLEGGE